MVELVSNVLSIDLYKEIVAFSLQDPLKEPVESVVFYHLLLLVFGFSCVMFQHLLMNRHLLFRRQVHEVGVAHPWGEAAGHRWLHHSRSLCLRLGLLMLLNLGHKLWRDWFDTKLLLPRELGCLYYRWWPWGIASQAIAHKKGWHILLFNSRGLDDLHGFFNAIGAEGSHELHLIRLLIRHLKLLSLPPVHLLRHQHIHVLLLSGRARGHSI
jgi:hypothetical protein